MPFDLNSTPAKSAMGAALLVVGLATGWFVHKAVSAPPDIPTLMVFDDWRMACPRSTVKDATCSIQQDVLDAKTHSEIAQLAVTHAKEGNTLTIVLPYNVLLEPGIGLGFGADKPMIYPYEFCDGGGCIIRIPFDDALAKKMIGAKEARVLFAGLDGKPVGLPFSVKGFVAAFSAFNNAEAKRHSLIRRIFS